MSYFVSMIVFFGSSVYGAQSLTSFADELRSHNISTREPDLIAALHHSDPMVRSAAAGKLAENNDLDAVPEISQALSSEKAPQVRVNMAAALSQLGSKEGADALEQICDDSKINPDVALDAARRLGELSGNEENKAGCLKSVLTLLRESSDQGNAKQAISVLGLYFSKSANETKQILPAVVIKLRDPDASTRIAAAEALAEMGDKSVLDDLKAAVRAEQDPNVRSSLELYLSKLQHRSSHQTN